MKGFFCFLLHQDFYQVSIVELSLPGPETSTILTYLFSYNKTENLDPGSWDMQQYTHLLIGQPASHSEDILEAYHDTHSVIARIPAYSGVSLDKAKFPPVQVRLTDACYLLKRLPTKEPQ